MSQIEHARRVLSVSLGLLLVGCGRSGANPSDAQATQAPSSRATLYGRWTIVAIDGVPPLRLHASRSRLANLEFSPSRYGGSTGCNSFGGTGLLVGDRWFGEPPIQTEQGCGHLETQENMIVSIAAGGPVIAMIGRSDATLTTRDGALRLRRQEGGEPPLQEPDPVLLAGTAWDVRAIDGRALPHQRATEGRREPRVTFEADRWTLTGLCSPLSGTWLQADRSVRIEVTSKEPRGCGSAERPADEAFRAMIAAAPRFVTGPNRELVMGGGGHWLAGQFDRAFGRDDKLLRGEWRIDTVDGTPPAVVERPASLVLGNVSYAVWDGCNHTEGVSLIVSRRLFTRGSGVSTLVNCPPDPLRARIRRIVGADPRIAKTSSGGLALVSRAGTLRMTRLSARGFGTGEQLGMRAPRTITLLNPNAKLVLLGAARFAVALDCGRIEGEWRGGQPARFSPDPLERTAPACARGPGSDAFRLRRFFTGNVLAVTGPNRDIVLLVNEDESIAARTGE